MRDHEDIYGYISITPERRQPIYEPDLTLLGRLAEQVTLATRLERLNQQAESSAILQERNRMARKIHDTLAQGFTGIVIQFEAAEALLIDEPGEAQAHLNRARELARTSLIEARRSVRALRPLALEENDLPAALRKMCEQLTNGSDLAATVAVERGVVALPSELTTDLLRLSQEGVTNTLRHSQASQLDFVLAFEPEQISL